MQPTQWSTTGIEIVAGKSVHVPLIVDEPALGSYSYTCNGFTCNGARWCEGQGRRDRLDTCEGTTGASKKLIMPKSNKAGEGTFHVPTGGIVTAYLSNDEAYLSSVTVQATVRLTPLTQAVAAEGASLRLAIDAQAAHLEMLEKHEAGLRTQELELEQKLASMRAARLAATYLRRATRKRTTSCGRRRSVWSRRRLRTMRESRRRRARRARYGSRATSTRRSRAGCMRWTAGAIFARGR